MRTDALPMSEAELQRAVLEMAKRFGWRVAHFRTANTSQGWMTPVAADGKGFPDLCMVRGGRLLFAELKASAGRLSPEQSAWLAALSGPAGGPDGDGYGSMVEVHVWKPADWRSGAVEAVLR